MKIAPIGLDFETLPIHDSPEYRVPEPVSYSLRMPGWRAPKFMAWGHRTGGNNCSRDDAKELLVTAYKEVCDEQPICCFNSAYDLNVALKWFDLPIPPWQQIEDPMFLLFLEDPHQRALGLKPSSERLLGMPPDEQDAVKDWVLAHKTELMQEFPEIGMFLEEVKNGKLVPGTIKPSNAGALIAYAPGTVVKPYANGDVTRMERLWKYLRPIVEQRGMMEAYNRERRLMTILSRNSQEGLRIDRTKLERDLGVYEEALGKCDVWLRKALKTPDLDMDKDAEVAEALDKSGQITEWTMTATGRKSISKKNMHLKHFKDKKVAAAYSYRQKCATILQTFIRPWLRYSAYDGWMRTTWNQVRNASRGDTGGTRTGRPSSQDPNFFNMPKPVEDNADRGFIMPTHIALPELPFVRSYILPDEKDHVIIRRDFNQQELRVLAHFEDGHLMQAYLENPAMDVHEFVRRMILDLLGLDLGRPITKTLNFGYIYGMGIPSLAAKLDKAVDEVKKLRKAQMTAVPGLKDLDDALKTRGRAGDFIQTWGGRQYYVEPPAWSDKYNKFMSFEYKLLNYLVQGSSADITKESIIRYDEARQDGRFMLSVYDENVISVPKKLAKKEALILRDCMMSIELDVPLLSDAEIGPNYGVLEDLAEPEPDLSRWNIGRGWRKAA